MEGYKFAGGEEHDMHVNPKVSKSKDKQKAWNLKTIHSKE